MPCGNGQTLSKRKHGVCVPRFSVLSGVLLLLCWLEARGSGPPEDGGSGSGPGPGPGPGSALCGPCPVNCSCALAGPPPSCVVNCSASGLDRAPAAADVPLATAVLDLSKNHISSLDAGLLERLSGLQELYLQGNRIGVLPRGVFCCGPLSVLDLSNNLITTIEERICDNLCNLTQIDLSGNPFECDCKLFRLVSQLQKKGVRVRRPHAMLCNQPPKLRQEPLLNVSLLTCGPNYAGCLEDSSRGGGGRSELVIFSSSTPGNFTREQCNSVCFGGASHLYGGLGERHECLCSTNSEPNLISEAQCSTACTDPDVMQQCGWTLARDVFVVKFSVALRPPRLQSVHEPAAFSATSSVTPLTLSWDFGDASSRVNTTGGEVTAAAHKYGLPGHYVVTVTAWAEHKEVVKVSTRGEVVVTLPPKLELHCPALAVANKSLEVSLVSWGAVGLDVDWKITKDGVQVAKASPLCPKDSVYHAESSSCFHIFPGELSWTDARQQCLDRGGGLAVVRGDALRHLLAPKVTQERGVWLGLSDVDTPGKLRWVNGSEAQEGEAGPPPRLQNSDGKVCVSLDQHGQTSSHLCHAQRAYMCQYNRQVRVPDAGVYAVGMSVFPSHNALHHVPSAPLSAPGPPSRTVETLLFPALSWGRDGRLSSLEFVAQELGARVHVRFQIYRPQCRYLNMHLRLPGCGGPACSPVAVCVPNDARGSEPPSCPPLQQWCPFQRLCLPLSSPCHTSSCPNCTRGHQPPPGTRRPRYSLQSEVAFSLPAGPSAHMQIQDQLEDILVSRGDVIALQHDGGPSALLRCRPSPHSQWRQPVLAFNRSEWFWLNNTGHFQGSSGDGDVNPPPDPELDAEALVTDGEGGWLDDVVCPSRVL